MALKSSKTMGSYWLREHKMWKVAIFFFFFYHHLLLNEHSVFLYPYETSAKNTIYYNTIVCVYTG